MLKISRDNFVPRQPPLTRVREALILPGLTEIQSDALLMALMEQILRDCGETLRREGYQVAYHLGKYVVQKEPS